MTPGPFLFQNKKSYQSLLEISKLILEQMDETQVFGKKEILAHLTVMIHATLSHISYQDLNEDDLAKMEVGAMLISKIHCTLTCLDMAHVSKALSSKDYFQSKQILEMIYFDVKTFQHQIVQAAKARMVKENKNFNPYYQ